MRLIEMSLALLSSTQAVVACARGVPQNLSYLPSNEVWAPPGRTFHKKKGAGEKMILVGPLVTLPHGCPDPPPTPPPLILWTS